MKHSTLFSSTLGTLSILIIHSLSKDHNILQNLLPFSVNFWQQVVSWSESRFHLSKPSPSKGLFAPVGSIKTKRKERKKRDEKKDVFTFSTPLSRKHSPSIDHPALSNPRLSASLSSPIFSVHIKQSFCPPPPFLHIWSVLFGFFSRLLLNFFYILQFFPSPPPSVLSVIFREIPFFFLLLRRWSIFR